MAIFKRLLLIITTLNVFALIHCQIDPVLKQRIDEVVENVYMSQNNAPGLGLSIVKDGEVLYNNGFGFRNLHPEYEPANNDTLFFIGSNSKSFTATLVVKILHENFPELGEAALDTPIAQLIPAYNFTLIDRYRSEQTTFRDILAHRTNTLPEGVGSFFGYYKDAAELSYRQRYAPEVYKFRTQFLYDNGNFAMAGELAAAISGVPYEQMLDDLFEQIGMEATTYIKADDNHDYMPNRATGFFQMAGILEKYNSELYKRTISMQAAGGIISSANDMAKYMMFHLNAGRVGGVQIIPEDVMKWLQRSSNPIPTVWKTTVADRASTEIAYTLGLMLGTYDGWKIIGHGGYLTPFNSHMNLYPDLNLGIFTVTNGPGRLLPDFSHKLLQEDIFDILYGLSKNQRSPTTPSDTKKELQEKATAFPQNLMELENQVPVQNPEILGHYGSGQAGELDITEKLNFTGGLELYMTYGPWGLAWLRPRESGNGDLVLHWDSDIIQEFYATDPNTELSVRYDDVSKTLMFFQDGYAAGIFYKDQHLDDLPPQPWDPDSCSPEEQN